MVRLPLTQIGIKQLFFASARGIVRGLNFFAVCYGFPACESISRRDPA